jgi:hypothetical protein
LETLSPAGSGVGQLFGSYQHTSTGTQVQAHKYRHTSTGIQVQEALPELTAANIHLFFLPSYSLELSQIEPIWQAVKHHEMAKRSFAWLGDLKTAVVEALTRKANALLNAQREKEQRPGDWKPLPICKTDKLLCANT